MAILEVNNLHKSFGNNHVLCLNGGSFAKRNRCRNGNGINVGTTGECRMHCIGFAPNHRTLEHHVNHLFRSTKGIRKMSWHMLLSTLKDVDGGVEYDRCKESEHLETRGETETQ